MVHQLAVLRQRQKQEHEQIPKWCPQRTERDNRKDPMSGALIVARPVTPLIAEIPNHAWKMSIDLSDTKIGNRPCVEKTSYTQHAKESFWEK
jgi:hypothetical protein